MLFLKGIQVLRLIKANHVYRLTIQANTIIKGIS